MFVHCNLHGPFPAGDNKGLVVTCWERANLLALLSVMFCCGFVTFPCAFLGQVWYLIASIRDLNLLTYLGRTSSEVNRVGKGRLKLNFTGQLFTLLVSVAVKSQVNNRIGMICSDEFKIFALNSQTVRAHENPQLSHGGPSKSKHQTLIHP